MMQKRKQNAPEVLPIGFQHGCIIVTSNDHERIYNQLIADVRDARQSELSSNVREKEVAENVIRAFDIRLADTQPQQYNKRSVKNVIVAKQVAQLSDSNDIQENKL